MVPLPWEPALTLFCVTFNKIYIQELSAHIGQVTPIWTALVNLHLGTTDDEPKISL